ncbi:MAG: hypothetical protein ACI959_000010 [Limisphaerales bacterium]
MQGPIQQYKMGEKIFMKRNCFQTTGICLLFGFLACSFFNSCNETTGIFPPAANLVAVQTDTFTVLTYTVKDDSVFTTNLREHLLGSDETPIFGKSTAGVYAEYLLPQNNLDFTPEDIENPTFYEFDSCVLSLRMLGYYGDEEALHSLEVFRMTEEIEAGSYNAEQTFLKEMMPIGQRLNFKIRPSDSANLLDGTIEPPQIRILLDLNGDQGMALGDQLFALSGDTGGVFKNDTSFLNYLPGLYVTAADTNSFGFSKGFARLDMRSFYSRINLYFTREIDTGGISPVIDTLSVRFPIANTSTTVGHYTHNYSGSEAANFLGNTDGQDSILFLQAMGGLKSIIKIPHLQDLAGEVAINKATLRFSLTHGTDIDSIHPAPNRVFFIEGDSTGMNQFVLINRTEELYLSVRDQFEGDVHYGGFRKTFSQPNGGIVDGYEVNLTREFQAILNNQVENDAFVLTPFPWFRTANRAVIGGFNRDSTDRVKMRIEILYTEIE